MAAKQTVSLSEAEKAAMVKQRAAKLVEMMKGRDDGIRTRGMKNADLNVAASSLRSAPITTLAEMMKGRDDGIRTRGMKNADLNVAASSLRSAPIITKTRKKIHVCASFNVSPSPYYCKPRNIPVFGSFPAEGAQFLMPGEEDMRPHQKPDKLVIHTSPLFDLFYVESDANSSNGSSPTPPHKVLDFEESVHSSQTDIAEVMAIESKTVGEQLAEMKGMIMKLMNDGEEKDEEIKKQNENISSLTKKLKKRTEDSTDEENDDSEGSMTSQPSKKGGKHDDSFTMKKIQDT
ncbi:uncharacterized protein [Spinacia oleracea]|uniref:Uncharacterized protein n=1 Tax=Spinacia oleracea TaxID=3562 RepID=A0A9R0KB00_SPIOL|nr:uncharacterized protein LOC110802771 [Spinacia oleracea]